MSKKLKIILGILIIGVLICLGIFLWYLNDVQNYRDDVAAIVIEDINPAAIPDGTYQGEYDVNYIYAKVEVTVQAGVITNIDLLEHKNGEGEPAEQIIDDILRLQSLKVDAVSGATNSSLVIEKAIENALTIK